MRDGWQVVTLGALCNISKGTSPTQKTPPGRYPLIVTGPEPLSSDTFQFEGEAVCVPLVSSTGHGHASLKRVHYARGKFAVANIIAACSPRDATDLDARYLFLYLQQFKDAEIVTRMKGTANVSLSITNLASVPVILPPLDEQRRIVDLVAAIGEAADAADAEAAGADSLLRATLDASVCEETAAIGSLASVISGASWGKADVRSVSEDGVTPVLTIANTKPDGSIRGELTLVHGLSAKVARLTSNSLVAIRTNGNHDRIGNVYRVSEEHVGAAVSAFQFVIEPIESADSDYLFWMMRAPSSQGAMTAGASGSTGLGNMAAGKLRKMRVPWPEDTGIRAAQASTFHSLENVALSARAAAEALRTLRSNLLTVLLSGDHEIPSSYDTLLEEKAT